MGKIKGIVAIVLFSILLVGCGNSNENENGNEANGGEAATPSASFVDIVTEIKEQIAEDLKAGGLDDALVDGNLTNHLEVDLTASDDSDPGVAIWIEKMGLNKDEIVNGKVIAAMMSVNSDEIILLEAKDEKDVASLKEALETELAGQVQTWQQYLPDQYEKVENNIIQTNGKFLLYVTYDYPEKIKDIFEASFK